MKAKLIKENLLNINEKINDDPDILGLLVRSIKKNPDKVNLRKTEMAGEFVSYNPKEEMSVTIIKSPKESEKYIVTFVKNGKRIRLIDINKKIFDQYIAIVKKLKGVNSNEEDVSDFFK